MATNKTQANDGDVEALLDAVANPARRADARALCELMGQVTGQPPVLWGTGIVGFGTVRYSYASGRAGEWMAVGFAPRAAACTVYLTDGFEAYADELDRLGPHTTGKSCLYLKRLADVDQPTLAHLIRRSYEQAVSQ
ncbi:MAG: DUF1801 domain-containing protein [Nocardioides sp.]